MRYKSITPKRLKFGPILLLNLVLLFVVSSLGLAEEPYKIGMILATTGPYASMGVEGKLGATLAAKRINEAGGVNGHKIELIFEDDEGDPGKGSMAIRKLTSFDKVAAIFGSTSNIVSHSISLIAEEMKVPMIAPVPSAKVCEGKKFVFQNAAKEEITVEFVGQYIQQIKKWKKVGILYDATEYGMNLSSASEKWLDNKGIAFVSAKFSPRATDVTPQWMSLKRDNVEGVFLAAPPLPAAAIAIKNRKQLGITTPVIGSTALSNQKTLDLAGDAAEGIVLVSFFHYGKWPPRQLEFIHYLNKHNPEVLPTLHHSLGWDGINLFATAMRKAGNDPVKIRDELEKIKKYPGAAGVYNFSHSDHNPIGLESMVYVRVQNGKFVLAEE